jgi:signal transduction histidine kinase
MKASSGEGSHDGSDRPAAAPGASELAPALLGLVDRQVLAEVCARAGRLGKLSVMVCDLAGAAVCAAGGAATPATRLLVVPERGQRVVVEMPGAERYAIAAVEHAAEAIGSVICGPYQPGEMADDDAGEIAQLVAVCCSALADAGWAQQVTSELHQAAAAASFRELERKNRMLGELVGRLQEVDRLKSSFLATVSHELRTPLTSIIGYSEMLLEGLAGELRPDQREYVRTIMDKGEQLLALISALIEISRFEAGSMTLERHRVPTADLIEQVARLARAQASRKGVRFVSEVAQTAPAVAVDRDKIVRALSNVVGNALKFTPAGGTVTIEAGGGVQGVQIIVRDNGIGIPLAALPHVFDPFFQVDSSPTREYGGAGLGLTMARSLVQAHGGTIAVDAAPGAGTTVTIHLPAWGPPTPTPQQEPLP